MNSKLTKILREKITVGENVRLPINLRLDTLADSIEINGMQEPMVVWAPVPGVVELLCGHRRLAASDMIAKRNPTKYKELFAEGLPCYMLTGITPVEALLKKLDHDGQEGLSSPYELQLTVNMLIAAGKAEAEVVALTSGLMDKVSPMSASGRTEYRMLIAKRDACNIGSPDWDIADKDARKRLQDYRHGLWQGLQAVAKCPTIVLNAQYKKATGQAPAGVTAYLPTLTAQQITKLAAAHVADMQQLVKGVPVYGKDKPGPTFQTLWDGICNASQIEDGKEKTAKPKSMSASDMKAEIAGRNFRAELTCKLIAYHAGDKTVSAELPELDTDAYYGGLVKAHDAAAWQKVVAEAKVIESKLAMAAQAAKTDGAKPVASGK